MNSKFLLIIIAVFTLILSGGGILVLSQGNSKGEVAFSENAKAFAPQKSFIAGEIKFSGGNIVKIFTIKNEGVDKLKLTNIRTSCHCTKAQVDIDGNLSPYFGMSSVSSWVGEVAPGKEAKLNLIFDPAYHGNAGLGSVQRFVLVETNDPQNPKLEFSLSGTVVK